MSPIAENLQTVRARIASACAAAGRPAGAVRLQAVSKTFPAEAVREAHAAGQCAFGENYIQEGVDKIAALRDLALEWHCIGPIQSNKTRLVAGHFDWVHSVDRLKIAQRLSEQRPPQLAPLQVCLQVNVSGEATKSGVEPGRALDLARVVAAMPGLRLRGFMAVPAPTDDVDRQRAQFRPLGQLIGAARTAGLDVDTLSMGMSDDLDIAIAAGATMVRVGTAIFGARPKRKD